jgi:hypothetical protein
MGTVRDAVTSRFGAAAFSLLSDESCSHHVRARIGYRIAGDGEILTDMPLEQLMMVMSAATFACDDEEGVSVARMVHWLVDKPDALPMVHVHSGFDLASRCLVSIALFRRAMEWRTRHRGCPPVAFYREAGVRAAGTAGMAGVASHFDNWSGFVGETLGG